LRSRYRNHCSDFDYDFVDDGTNFFAASAADALFQFVLLEKYC